MIVSECTVCYRVVACYILRGESEKLYHYTFVHNSGKCWPIFTILSQCCIFQEIFIVLLAAKFCQFFFFCVLPGSGVTPLTCDEIYDMDFVANFVEHMTVKKLIIGRHRQSYERMYSGTVFFI